jgi:hypothetical protein
MPIAGTTRGCLFSSIGLVWPSSWIFSWFPPFFNIFGLYWVPPRFLEACFKFACEYQETVLAIIVEGWWRWKRYEFFLLRDANVWKCMYAWVCKKYYCFFFICYGMLKGFDDMQWCDGTKEGPGVPQGQSWKLIVHNLNRELPIIYVSSKFY